MFAPPYHPYTEALLSAVPIADTSVRKKHIVLKGEMPSPMNLPPGCPFQTRCHRKIGLDLRNRDAAGQGHAATATRSSAICRTRCCRAMEPVIAMSKDPVAADPPKKTRKTSAKAAAPIA